MPKCPICQVIRNERYGSITVKCQDCSDNESLLRLWGSYEILETIYSTNRLFMYWFPALLVAGDIFLIAKGAHFGTITSTLTAWGMWAFNVFWLWPKNKCRPKDVMEQMKDLRDKMQIAKFAAQ